MRTPWSHAISLKPVSYILPAEERHMNRMCEVWLAAFRGQGLARYKVSTNMCNSVILSNKMGHVMVCEVDGEIRGWFSLRELTEGEHSVTDAQTPAGWQRNMLSLLLERIQEVREEHPYKSVLTDPRQHPDEILAHHMAFRIFENVPRLSRGPVFLLDTVVVEPAHSGNGFGTKMIKEACSFARRYQLCLLAVVPEASKHLFCQCGFQSIGGSTITWKENFKNAPGVDKYHTMIFDPNIV